MTNSKSFLIGAVTAAIAAHAIVIGIASRRKQAAKKEKNEVAITLPEWAVDYYDSLKDTEFTSDEDMMLVAIEISRRNVAQNTGGPFGCAIFEKDTTTGKCKLFSVGANRVVPLNNSTLHGEMVAIQFAQKKLKHFSLSGNAENGKEYFLFTSCEPCAMCLGGTLWSGVSKIVCAATKDDAEAIGFNEGPVFPESYKALESAGCKVVRNVLREESAKVLQNYGETGVIYNR